MSVDEATVRRVASLARIAVREEDLPALAGEINGILGFVEQLGEVDVDGIEPMTSGHADEHEDARGYRHRRQQGG